MKDRRGAPGASGRRRLWWLIPLVLLGGAVAAALGASIYGEGLIEARLRKMAEIAGLQLVHDGISVSPRGHASVTGLRLVRADGTDVLRVGHAIGELSPLQALSGRRRPERLAIEGLRLHVRVVDGRPTELIDLARAAREAIGRRPSGAAKKPTKRAGQGTAIRLTDGEIRVDVTGKGAELLPNGLKLAGLRVDLDTAQGKGDVAATLSGSAAAKLSAQLLPATAERPARVAARFSPELRLPLPKMKGIPPLVDAVVVAGFGYDSVDGPRVEGVALRKGADTVVKVARVRLASEGVGVALGSVTVQVRHGALRRALGQDAHAKKKRHAKKEAGAQNGKTKKKANAKTWPADDALWRATVAHVEVVTSDDGAVRLRAGAASATLPDDMGVARSDRLEVVAAVRGGLQGVRLVKLAQPALHLRWRESGITRLPRGAQLFWAVERLRRGATRPDDDDADKDSASNGDGKNGKSGEKGEAASGGAKKPKTAKERRAARLRARRAQRRARRQRGKRIPATRALITPVRALHRTLLATDAHVQALFSRIDGLAAAEVQITGAELGLLAPAAKLPFGGLRGGALQLSRRLSDGSRSLSATIEPFLGETPLDSALIPAAKGAPSGVASGSTQGAAAPKDGRGWGPARLAIQTAPGGHLAKATLSLGGKGWAQALSTIGRAASVQPDAKLTLDLTLTATAKTAMALTGTVAVAHVGVNWWRIAPRPIDDFSFSGELHLSATAQPAQIELKLRKLDLGGAKLNLTLAALDLAKRPTARLWIEAPEQDCGAIAKAIPASLIPTIGAIEAEGALSGDFDLRIPLDNPYKGKLKAHLNDEQCVVTRFGELDVTALARPFKRPVNESGTILEDQFIGPKSDAWVPLSDLPPWVPYAMIATEDAAFYHHKGVRIGLTSRAIKMCLDYGRFVYGGSTITQQLVKNLFLTRDKYLGRKFEELLIVWHMERSLMDADAVEAAIKRAERDGVEGAQPIKDRILEIYINGIEFAPHVYGIQRAAKLYFGKDAKDLTPLETAFLAANKPCPKCGHKRFEQQKWTAWWQERMVGIMNKMRTRGIITEEQFVAEAPYVPHFQGWPQAAAPGAEGGSGDVGGAEE